MNKAVIFFFIVTEDRKVRSNDSKCDEELNVALDNEAIGLVWNYNWL